MKTEQRQNWREEPILSFLRVKAGSEGNGASRILHRSQGSLQPLYCVSVEGMKSGKEGWKKGPDRIVFYL